MKDAKTFDDLEAKLGKVDFMRNFSGTVTIYFDPNLNVRKSITNLLKKLLSKELALQFVTSKPTEGKRVFKDTNLCKTLFSAIASSHKEGKENKDAVTLKSFLKELSAVFPNAKDWDGGRSNRKRKNILRETEGTNISS
ncbi:uncharacterized protein LOC122506342 [Leptopilina heterotoma]|uniref:uncharacterized protein LOC122506342 n=1 Tax=Leptopilina heterotoma TaxID=63436 RepID=UPI001CA81903|nr:uncharacterized protein LOC122506342 [Leptopilina heterotoma]